MILGIMNWRILPANWSRSDGSTRMSFGFLSPPSPLSVVFPSSPLPLSSVFLSSPLAITCSVHQGRAGANGQTRPHRPVLADSRVVDALPCPHVLHLGHV